MNEDDGTWTIYEGNIKLHLTKRIYRFGLVWKGLMQISNGSLMGWKEWESKEKVPCLWMEAS